MSQGLGGIIFSLENQISHTAYLADLHTNKSRENIPRGSSLRSTVLFFHNSKEFFTDSGMEWIGEYISLTMITKH